MALDNICVHMAKADLNFNNIDSRMSKNIDGINRNHYQDAIKTWLAFKDDWNKLIRQGNPNRPLITTLPVDVFGTYPLITALP